MKSRAEACIRLVRTAPAKDTVIAALARTVINRHIDVTALDLAHKWLCANGPLDEEHNSGAGQANYKLEKAVLESGDLKFQTHVAYAMAIAAQENHTRSGWRK